MVASAFQNHLFHFEKTKGRLRNLAFIDENDFVNDLSRQLEAELAGFRDRQSIEEHAPEARPAELRDPPRRQCQCPSGTASCHRNGGGVANHEICG